MTVAKASADAKLRLTEYLSDRIQESLAGRDELDIEGTPLRAVFAGVLQSPWKPGVKKGSPDSPGSSPPLGTSIGVTFRVKPTAGDAAIEVEPSCAVYQSVFPSYEQVLRSNPALNATDLIDGNGDGDAKGETPETEDSSPADVHAQPEDALLLGGEAESDRVDVPEEEVDADQPMPVEPPDRVFLPVTWRRREVPLIATVLKVGSATDLPPPEVIPLEGGFRAAQVAASTEALGWRHLGDPKERERFLGTVGTLDSAEAYELALSSRRERVDPPTWSGEIIVSSRAEGQDLIRITVLFCNTTPYPEGEDIDGGLIETEFFDSQLTVRLKNCELVPFQFLLAPKDYRSNPLLAVKGINCTGRVSDTDPSLIVTEALPIYQQPLYRTRDELQVAFADLAGDDAVAALQTIHKRMCDYLGEWDRFLKSPAASAFSADERRECEGDRGKFAIEAERFRLGLDCLENDATLRDAFRLMNQAFSVIAERSGGRLRAWRLFQVGFICSQLPALAIRQREVPGSPEHKKALTSAHEEVGVLWFPTGGGKTEAYLGLIATALLFDRLRGKERGLTAWMRFPLRMLSLQQMERLARVTAVLNELRAQHARLNVGDPFAIGYYVGDANTPNRVSADRMAEYEASSSKRDGLRLLRRCPFCDAHLEMKVLRSAWRLAHVCPNPACFSNTSNTLGKLQGTVPVFVVDTEVYRYLPAILVGTVDKLAIIARSKYFFEFLRGTTQECPSHGYTAYDECIESQTFYAGCKTKKKDLLPIQPFFDPGPALLIQDELHLLSAELGVFNGHYEGLLRHIADGVYLRPKILAATATIQAYGTQAFHLYLSAARRFPEPGWMLGESFYATSTPKATRRHFLGVLSHGRAVEDVALKVIGVYQREVRRLKADYDRARRVIGATDASDDEIADLLRLYDLSVAYVNRKATGGSIIDKLSRAEALLDMPDNRIRHQFLTGDQSIEDVGTALDRIEREARDTGDERLDLLIATSLISHGVDLERINMMVVCGMPSHYAQYVQSSSRCARSHPGIVVVCFNGRDPRELSQFELFAPMHQHVDRLVEAVAINRFASNAAEKTVPGLLAGLLLSDYSPRLYRAAKISRALDDVQTLQVALGLKAGKGAACMSRDELRDALYRIIGLNETAIPSMASQIANARRRVDDAFDSTLGIIGRTFERHLADAIHPITSFRDVDEGVEFGSLDSSTLVTRIRER